MRWIKLGLLVSVMMMVGVGAASADEGTAVTVDGQLYILDGRVNSWDVAAPVAVYCKHEDPDVDAADSDADSLTGIELLGIDTNNNGYPVLWADEAQLAAVGDQPARDSLIVSASGYSLYRAHSGEFYVVAPPDDEGKVYSFVWEEGDPGC